MMSEIIPVEHITEMIFAFRNTKVMVDADLAKLYGVETKVLNQAVKRNEKRFPEDFRFRLTSDEKNELVTNCDRFSRLKHSTTTPNVFTEAGVAMLSSVLNSDTAIQMNIQIIRAFIQLKQLLATEEVVKLTLEKMNKQMGQNTRNIQILSNTIQQMINPPIKDKKLSMGFTPPKKKKE